MTTRFPGGLIRKTPPTITPPVGGEGGSAPGVWTLEQASYYTKQGTWPLPPRPKGLFLVGRNTYGELGLNDTVNRSSPVQVGSLGTWLSVATGQYATAAIQTNNTLWLWGSGQFGQLGNSSVTDVSSPVQVGALTNWSSVSVGYISCAAIRTDGTLWTWGNGGQGQLGLNNRVNYSSPVQVGSDTNWALVSCGIYATGAIKTTGTLYMWGGNQGQNGLLGLNDNGVQRSSPTQVGALTTWLNVCVGQYFCVATKTDGTIWSWGTNSNGYLGDNTTINRSSPVQIGALTTWSTTKTSGYVHAVALKNDGTLWTWGWNVGGDLGQNNLIDRSSPVQVGSDTNWTSQFAVFYGGGTAAIKTNGTLWVWGAQGTGKLGVNNRTAYSSPIQVGSDTTWSKTSVGYAYNNALIKSI